MIMTKDKYHHGTLRSDMINKGLILLNKEGFEGFSLRKVAGMCGVSHTAPYKHFKDKEELIQAIILEVSEAFKNSLLQSTLQYPDKPRLQIIEMGKSYVRFMVENPEYLKFLFLNENKYPAEICKDRFLDYENTPFQVFKNSAESYLTSIGVDKDKYYIYIFEMWSLVHGAALLIVNKAISYDGDYTELVFKMLNEGIK